MRLEKGSPWYPILAVGLSMVAFICIKSGRDGVFFNQEGLLRLPTAYVWIALAATVAAMVHLRLMRRWGPRPVRLAVILATAVTLMAFTPLADPGHPTAVLVLFIYVPVIFGAVFAATWMMAGDLLDGTDQGEMGRVYAWIGAGSMAGGMGGGALASLLSAFAHPRYLVTAGGLIMLLVAALVHHAHRRHPLESPSGESSRPSGDERVMRLDLLGQPYVLGLLGISSLGAVAALFVDFQFYAVATQTGRSTAQFFSHFYLVLNLSALLLQLFVAPWLQERLGIGGVLLALPVSLLGMTGVVSLHTTILSRSALKVTEGGVKASLQRSVWEQTYLPIERELRDHAKVLVDGAGARMAEGAAAAALYVWLTHLAPDPGNLDLSWLSWGIAASAAGWMALIGYLVHKGCSDADAEGETIRLPDG